MVKLAERFLIKITDDMPMRVIGDGEREYLVRHYVGTFFGRRHYIHWFKGGDPDLGLHNHKWMAWSIPLLGWYWEERQWGRIKVRWFNRIDPDTMHRVVLPLVEDKKKRILRKQECWTLFSHEVENAVSTWGFRRNLDDSDGWVFVPYRYEREGSQTEWWLHAKSRKQLRGVKP